MASYWKWIISTLGPVAWQPKGSDRFEASQVSLARIASFLPDLYPFLERPVHRFGSDVHRIVYAGELSPESNAADVLPSLSLWAERNPDRQLDVVWIGEGELSGVLQAQPLPDNMSHRFLGRLDRPAVAASFARFGILIAPNPVQDCPSLAAEALAAGLVVIGSRHDPVCARAREAGLGVWTVDPLYPNDLLQAFERVLARSLDELNRLRADGRAFVSRMRSCGLEDIRTAPEPVPLVGATERLANSPA